MQPKESIETITNILWRIKDQKDLSEILEDLLTPGELTDIADRITILRLLKAGKSQRDIAGELGISVTTVSRGNRVLQYGGQSIHKYLM